MANSKRLIFNKEGKMFIPMNVEGVWNENFITTTKIIVLCGLIVGNFIVALWLSGINGVWGFKLLMILGMIFIDQLLLRKVVFEENYYYKMYNKMKEHGVTTPAIFWNIANIRNTEDGAILIYSDMKVGVLLKVERDTITGKNEEFREQHFDAISDFYRELNLRKYKIVQLNLMEQAGKDPRVQNLSELVVKSDNKNIASLVELQIGYIKSITRATLFETDYFLIYTDNISKSTTIISDVTDSVYKLLDGAFIGYKILTSNEIIELVKEIYGVKFFDFTEAVLNVFKNNSVSIGKSLLLKEIHFKDGENVKIGETENYRLNYLTSYILNNSMKYGELSIRKALKGEINKSEGEVKGVGSSINRAEVDSIEQGLGGGCYDFKNEGGNFENLVGQSRVHNEKNSYGSVDNIQQNDKIKLKKDNRIDNDDEVIDL